MKQTIEITLHGSQVVVNNGSRDIILETHDEEAAERLAKDMTLEILSTD